MIYLLLFWEFFKTGLFAVSGGMATIPFLTQMAEKYPQWMSVEQLADMIALSESTPGPVGINMATFVGYNVAGIPGALVASLSIVAPAFIILLLIARTMEKWRANRWVNAGFAGLRPAVTGLIAAAAFTVMSISLWPGGQFQALPLVLFAAILVCTQLPALKKLHPLVYIAGAAAGGIVLKL